MRSMYHSKVMKKLDYFLVQFRGPKAAMLGRESNPGIREHCIAKSYLNNMLLAIRNTYI
jgi:hypothetical protein